MKNKFYTIITIAAVIFSFTFAMIYGVKPIIYQIRYNKRLNEILEDDKEIEKKWLIDRKKIPYDLSKAEISKIEQTYICFSPEMRVRKINDGKQYTFTIKTNMSEDGMVRDETEIEITEEEYNNLIQKKEGNTINKTRYQFLDNNNQFLAIDIFSGDLEGLAYLEIEFKNKEEANKYNDPDWTIKDVTNDLNYKNGYLARYGIPKR